MSFSHLELNRLITEHFDVPTKMCNIYALLLMQWFGAFMLCMQSFEMMDTVNWIVAWNSVQQFYTFLLYLMWILLICWAQLQ